MSGLADIAFPLFGLILIGFGFGKVFKSASLDGLAWLNIFIIYAALPALFIKLVALAPVEQLTRFGYAATTTYTTLIIFVVCFLIYLRFSAQSTVSKGVVAGLAGADGNIG